MDSSHSNHFVGEILLDLNLLYFSYTHRRNKFEKKSTILTNRHGTKMVLQIVLPEPNNYNVNQKQCTSGYMSEQQPRGLRPLQSRLNSNQSGSSNNNNNLSNDENNNVIGTQPDRSAEAWLRRTNSVTSLTESRIGEDSLFSYGAEIFLIPF